MNKMKGIIRYIAFGLVALAVSSCASVMLKTPDGFAQFTKEKTYKAASADGVYLEAYPVVDKGIEEATAEKVWTDEMDRVLKARGYVFVSSKDIQVADGKIARYREYEVLHNGETYVYTCALVKSGAKLFLVESGGPQKEYARYRQGIIDAVGTLEVK